MSSLVEWQKITVIAASIVRVFREVSAVRNKAADGQDNQ
jgi:hypothetical protein